MSNNAGHTRHPFIKMHGLGNDFVIFDRRKTPLELSAGAARRIADRRWGIGCDQVLLLEPSDQADAFMRIYNADGSKSAACGDGARCIAAYLSGELGRETARIETEAGVLDCHLTEGGAAANMGKPSFDWRDVPLAEERDTLHLGLEFGALADPVALSIGNPHVVFFVGDVDAIGLATVGPMIETYFLFPERTNVGVACVIDQSNIRLRVWERGAGLTQACGTGACAATVAAAARGLAGRECTVHLPGGEIHVDWRDDGDVIMTGAVATSFDGAVTIAALEGPGGAQ